MKRCNDTDMTDFKKKKMENIYSYLLKRTQESREKGKQMQFDRKKRFTC